MGKRGLGRVKIRTNGNLEKKRKLGGWKLGKMESGKNRNQDEIKFREKEQWKVKREIGKLGKRECEDYRLRKIGIIWTILNVF